MRNMRGVQIQPPEERLAEWKGRVRQSLQTLTEMNEADGAIDATCVELATLHSAFSHKHMVMRQMRGRLNLDRHDPRGERAGDE